MILLEKTINFSEMKFILLQSTKNDVNSLMIAKKLDEILHITIFHNYYQKEAGG